MNKLEPCPFCGSEGLYLLEDYDNLSLEKYYVFCNSCKTSFSNENAEDSEEETAEWWNGIKR